MDPLLDVVRHEVKFAGEGIRAKEIEQWVRLHPAGFYAPYPPRRVNNVYFDNHALFAYQENLIGASMRSKLRLRWYGENDRPERGTLEVKRRRNMVGWKLSYPTPGFDLANTSWRGLRGAMRGDLPADARIWLDANPQPVLINRYFRQYWVSRDGLVRVTIDRDQSVYDQRVSPQPNTRRRGNLPDTLVVEFKFAPAHRLQGSRAIQGIPIRVSRNSKYVIGVQSLLPA